MIEYKALTPEQVEEVQTLIDVALNRAAREPFILILRAGETESRLYKMALEEVKK